MTGNSLDADHAVENLIAELRLIKEQGYVRYEYREAVTLTAWQRAQIADELIGLAAKIRGLR